MVESGASGAPLRVVELDEQVVEVSFADSITKLRVWGGTLRCGCKQILSTGIILLHVCAKPFSHGAIAYVSVRLNVEIETINNVGAEWTRPSPARRDGTKHFPHVVREGFAIRTT